MIFDHHPGGAELPLTPRAVVWAKSGVLQRVIWWSIWWFSMTILDDIFWDKEILTATGKTPVIMRYGKYPYYIISLSKCFVGEYLQLDERWNMMNYDHWKVTAKMSVHHMPWFLRSHLFFILFWELGIASISGHEVVPFAYFTQRQNSLPDNHHPSSIIWCLKASSWFAPSLWGKDNVSA